MFLLWLMQRYQHSSCTHLLEKTVVPLALKVELVFAQEHKLDKTEMLCSKSYLPVRWSALFI